MIFPLSLRQDVPWVEYTNCSDGWIDSLIEQGVIDPVTGKPHQPFFELDISSTLLLQRLQASYELTPRLHIGCSMDERPPSLSCTKKWVIEERTLILAYNREILLEAVQRNQWYRTAQGNRDLSAVARALSDSESYRERLSLLKAYPGRTERIFEIPAIGQQFYFNQAGISISFFVSLWN